MMSDDDDLRTRIAEVLNSFPADMRPVAVVNLEKADAVIRELESWDTLMWLLDSVYPTAVFPTLPDDPHRDPGPRIISLLRLIHAIRYNTQLGETTDD